MSILAIDIGGSAIKYGLVSSEGELLSKGSVKNDRIDYPSFITTLKEVVKEHLTEATEGIALSIPAIINPKTGMIVSEASMPFLVGINLKEVLESEFKLKVHNENDGNCAALAEIWMGAGKSCDDIALVVIGTGVGGAIVKDGKVHTGANFVSGEFGYLISDYDFEKDDIKIWSDTGAMYTLAKRMFALKGKQLSGIEIFDLAETGDQDAVKEVNLFYQSTAVGLFNIQYTYDPEMIVIGGAVSSRIGFVDQIELRMNKIMDLVAIAPIRPTIRVAKYGNDANLLGAVYNYLQLEMKI